MEFIYVGEIVNTHGIRGELRILSDFEYKNLIFKKDFKIYVGKRKEEKVLASYRVHKNYDMVTFVDIDNINEAIAYKGDSVYINREDIKEDVVFKEDIIGCSVYYQDNLIGTVENILKSNAHDILVIKENGKTQMIPYIDEFVKKIDSKNKRMEIEVIEGLLNED